MHKMPSKERDRMNQALKKIVVPFLREHKFKGSLLHFRRMNEKNIDLVTFQFNKWGGSFLVELAACPLEGATMHWGEQIPPNKVTAHDLNQRFRLGSKSEEEDGIWFNFENAKTDEDFEQVAFRVIDLLKIKDPLWIASLFDE